MGLVDLASRPARLADRSVGPRHVARHLRSRPCARCRARHRDRHRLRAWCCSSLVRPGRTSPRSGSCRPRVTTATCRATRRSPTPACSSSGSTRPCCSRPRRRCDVGSSSSVRLGTTACGPWSSTARPCRTSTATARTSSTRWRGRWTDRGVALHLATVRGPVRDALDRTGTCTAMRDEGRLHEDVGRCQLVPTTSLGLDRPRARPAAREPVPPRPHGAEAGGPPRSSGGRVRGGARDGCRAASSSIPIVQVLVTARTRARADEPGDEPARAARRGWPGWTAARSPGDEADLPLEVPADHVLHDRTVGLLPGHDPTLDDRELGQPGGDEPLLGLVGTGAGAAEQHDLLARRRQVADVVDVPSSSSSGRLRAEGTWTDSYSPGVRTSMTVDVVEAVLELAGVDAVGAGGHADPSGRVREHFFDGVSDVEAQTVPSRPSKCPDNCRERTGLGAPTPR
jgi:hypothetical protein